MGLVMIERAGQECRENVSGSFRFLRYGTGVGVWFRMVVQHLFEPFTILICLALSCFSAWGADGTVAGRLAGSHRFSTVREDFLQWATWLFLTE